MAEVSPQIRSRLNTLSPELRAAVLAKDGPLRTLGDLIGVLDQLIREQEASPARKGRYTSRPFRVSF